MLIVRTILGILSEGEKCCHNKKIPEECIGFCTPVSELARSNSIVEVCNKVMDSIIECRDMTRNAGVAGWIYGVAIAPILLGLVFVTVLVTWYQRRKKSKVNLVQVSEYNKNIL